MKTKREHYVTCGQMRILERRADADGLSYYQMMENAGTYAAETILDKMAYKAASIEENSEKRYSESLKAAEKIIKQIPVDKEKLFVKHLEKSVKTSNDDMTALLFCGKGNNGGDGFVVARLLCNAGYKITIVLVDGEPKTADAVTNFNILKDMSVEVFDMSSDERVLMKLKKTPHVIVDAIYGTGFHGKPAGNALKAAIYINRYSGINNSELPGSGTDRMTDGSSVVFALDIPSGLGGDLTDEKELGQGSVAAHYTVTFHARKPVHLQKFAQKYCGEIIVADIGIDEDRLWNVEY